MFDALVARVQRAVFGEPDPEWEFARPSERQPDWGRPAPGLPDIIITRIKNESRDDDDELSPTPLCIVR